MKKSILCKLTHTLILILCLSFIGNAQKKTTSSIWHLPSFSTDEVPRQEYSYDKKAKLMYAITNDSTDLYINLLAVDPAASRNILVSGFTVWIDVTGKNKKNVGVKFPLAREQKRPSERPRDGSNRREGEMEPDDLRQGAELELIGFGGVESHVVKANKENDVNGTMRLNEYNELVYTLKIPYKKLGFHSLLHTTISINMLSGDLPARSGADRSGPPNRGGGGGMRSGGGRPGGGGGSRGASTASGGMSSPINLKIKKIKLVSSNLN